MSSTCRNRVCCVHPGALQRSPSAAVGKLQSRCRLLQSTNRSLNCAATSAAHSVYLHLRTLHPCAHETSTAKITDDMIFSSTSRVVACSRAQENPYPLSFPNPKTLALTQTLTQT